MRRMHPWWLGLALFSLAACGDPMETDDGGIDAATPDAAAADSGVDSGPPDSGSADAGPGDAGPPGGELGAPCTTGADCASDICFPAGFGTGVCTETCPSGESCPEGWDCGTFGGDMVCRCEASAETCNGLDDDCDGAVDEGRPEAIGCGEAQICTSGSCGCPVDRMCGGGCVDITTDPAHCGACDAACTGGEVCTDGSCCAASAETCNGTDDDCDGMVDEGSAAAVGCGAMEACIDGSCACPDVCGGVCVDTDFDRAHCGGCDIACPGSLDCVRGVCCVAAGTRVDVLFMVDNSGSMVEEQALLTDQLPRLVEVLATGDLDGDGTPESEPVRDLHLGVITPDMGAGGFTTPGCAEPNFGDDGVLRTAGNGAGCDLTYPSFLEFRPADGGDPSDTADDFACVAVTGAGGCGFEQQLEAVLKAITPSTTPIRFFRDTPGNADGANAGFLRDDSVLVTFLLTDENDCSARDPELFNLSSSVYPGDPNLRCSEYPAALHTLTRYTDGFLNTRRDPRDFIFAAVSGVPEDLLPSAGSADYARILADPRMAEVPVAGESRLTEACGTGGRSAFPGRRYVRLAQELEDRGATSVLGSICDASFAAPITGVLDRIVQRLRESCMGTP